jgi:hypothetical protein
MRSRTGSLAATVLVGSLAACGGDSLPSPSAVPSPAATRDGRWVQDLDYLSAELTRLHANLFFRTPRADFERAVEDVRQAVPRLSDAEVVIGIMRIVALVGDAHTGVQVHDRFHRLPVELTRLADGLYVTAVPPEQVSLLGARVVAFGERGVAEMEGEAAQLVGHENEAWLRVRLPDLLTMAEVVQFLAREPDRVPLWVDLAGGGRVTVSLDPGAPAPALVNFATAAGGSVPLYRQRVGENYWMTALDGTRTLYVQYNRCQNGPESFSSFADRLFRQLDGGAFDRLVVDVRNNSGGDSQVDDPLFAGLERRPTWRSPGRLFGLIGGETFSSGLWTADDLRKQGATLVGSPTGGKPNSYGNVRTFRLSNSRLEVSYSTRFYSLAPGADPPSLEPAVPVEVTIDDLRAGRDPALDAALRHPGR